MIGIDPKKEIVGRKAATKGGPLLTGTNILSLNKWTNGWWFH